MTKKITHLILGLSLVLSSCAEPLLEEHQEILIIETISEHIHAKFPFYPDRFATGSDDQPSPTDLFGDGQRHGESFEQYLTREVASLHDGHTSIRLTDKHTGRPHYLYGAYPGIRVRKIGEGYYIERLSDGYAENLAVGDKIISVVPLLEGIDAGDVKTAQDLAGEVADYIPASNSTSREQYAANSLITHAVLQAENYDQIKFSVEREEVNLTVTIDRATPGDQFARRDKPFSVWLEGRSLYYIAIPTMGYLDDINKLDTLINEGIEAEGMILDLRGNGGGSSAVGEYLISRFNLSGDFKFTIRGGISSEITNRIGPPKPRGEQYDGQVAILTDHYVFSAANHFLALCDYANSKGLRSPAFTIIGGKTGGGSAIPELHRITPTITLRLSERVITDPEGNHAERGISPDIAVFLTVEDVSSGYHTYPLTQEQMDKEELGGDLVLARAVEVIQGETL
jgi:C-terminal processing protease CtpA/Prc